MVNLVGFHDVVGGEVTYGEGDPRDCRWVSGRWEWEVVEISGLGNGREVQWEGIGNERTKGDKQARDGVRLPARPPNRPDRPGLKKLRD